MYLPEGTRFSNLLKLPEGTNIGMKINDAMRAIEAENEELGDEEGAKDKAPWTYPCTSRTLSAAVTNKEGRNIPPDPRDDPDEIPPKKGATDSLSRSRKRRGRTSQEKDLDNLLF